MTIGIIEDGTGDGFKLQISQNNRLRGEVISEPMADHAAEIGQRYNLNTGEINLTSSNESSVFYCKNNDTRDLFITSFIYNLGTTTGGSGDWLIDVHNNPTSGTIVSGATDVEMKENMRVGDPNTLTANIYKGAEGNTMTGGSRAISTLTPTNGRKVVALGATVIPPGKSIGVKVKPPPGNTNVDIQIAAACFVQTLEI